MKKTFIALMIAFSLASCATTQPEIGAPTVIVKNVYLIPKVADDIVTVPPNVPSIDTSKATQSIVGQWVIDNEKRTATLENKILAMKNITNALVKKEKLKEGDFKVIELGKEELGLVEDKNK